MRFIKLTQSDSLKGVAFVLGRWRVVAHRTKGLKGHGYSASIWHHNKQENT